jgi:hypothetical protein
MNLPKIRPVQNKQVKPPKIDHDIAYAQETLNQPLEAGFYVHRLCLGMRPPEFTSGPEYFSALYERIGAIGISGVTVDLAASFEASMVPNPYGLNNEANKYWRRDHNVLVLTRQVGLSMVPEPLEAEIQVPFAAAA